MMSYNLSSRPNKPCIVISMKNCTLMLDCGLDMSSAMNFLPLPLVPSHKLNTLSSFNARDSESQLEGELRECNNFVFVDSPPEFKPPLTGYVDFCDLDAIIISNYLSMLALPYVVEETKFKGVVLMTEPTLQMGRLFMEELVAHIERTPKAKQAVRWKHMLRSLPIPLSEAKLPKSWQIAYDNKAITNALSYVQIVAYNEKINICGALTVTAISSGFCLGSCNWVISSHHEKIVYLSASSTLTTHPRPLESAPLKEADALILTSLSNSPIHNPDSMLGEFCVTVAQTIRNGGCALVPCYPSGVVYDLFECLSSHLQSVNLANIPIFFISPVADSSLAYSNIFSEWLSVDKQNKVHQMEDPFSHGQLTKSGRLKAFKNIYGEEFASEYRQPCIMFCGHPSLRFGDAVHFIEMWGNNPLNVVLFTEPEFDFVHALAPYQPLAIRPVHCPIDTSLNFTQAKKLLADLKPKRLLVPENYTKSSIPHRPDLSLELEDNPITFDEYQTLFVNLCCPMESAELMSDLASSLNPVSIRSGTHASVLTAALHVQDNKFELKHPSGPSQESEAETLPKFYAYGKINAPDFIKKLHSAGFDDAKLEEDSSGCLITMDSPEVVIQFRDNSTHIITSSSKVREKISQILLSLLNHF